MGNPLADPANWEDEDARAAQRAYDADPSNPKAEKLREKIKAYMVGKYGVDRANAAMTPVGEGDAAPNIHETTLDPVKIEGDATPAPPADDSILSRLSDPKLSAQAYVDTNRNSGPLEGAGSVREPEGPTSHYVSPWEALARGGGQGFTGRF